MDNMQKMIRNEDGTLPSFAWPGGYPLVYSDTEFNQLCPECANEQDQQHTLYRKQQDKDYVWSEGEQEVSDVPRIVYCDIYQKGPSFFCDGDCDTLIESAYGDPDGDNQEG